MKTNSTWTHPALALVRKYAPNTYEAMLGAQWPLRVITGPEDFLPVIRQVGYDAAHELAGAVDQGLGVTVTRLRGVEEPYDGPPELYNTTWLNRRAIEGQAARMGVSAVKLAATVIVHEWRHRRGYGEEEAYTAGTRLALDMGEHAIARVNEYTRRQARQEALRSFTDAEARKEA